MIAEILVVEDETIIADHIEVVLRELGYAIAGQATTGEQAIRIVEKKRPSLVLMDIKIRGPMDGIDTASVLRARFGTPVIYLTSYSDDATLARAKLTEPYGYLLKPFTDRELRTSIEVALTKHQLESSLAEREHWYATTLDSVGDAVIATDHQDRITFLNPVAEALTGWSRHAAAGRKLQEIFELVGGNSAHPMEGSVRRTLAQGFSVQLSTTATQRARAKPFALDKTKSFSTDTAGANPKDTEIVVFRDISDQRQMEQRLALTERLASIGTMAAGMGHEINNPLSYVVANVAFGVEQLDELAKSVKTLDGMTAPVAALLLNSLAEIRDALSEAENGANRVRRIVQDLKRFSRADDTQLSLVDLPGVLDSAVKMTGNTVRHHATIRTEYGTTPYVEANEGQMVQVFTNLLVNAAQAMTDGDAEKNQIRLVTYTTDEGRAVVEVHDTGCGIPESARARIFDPFFTTKPVGSGTGLGLSISHRIITSIGGDMTVESEVGRGTMFRITLNGATRAKSLIPEPTPLPKPVRRGKVFVIDDEEAVTKTLHRILRNDHDVTTEVDSNSALSKLLLGENFDIIFCDLMMPNLGGIDLYERLAQERPEIAKRIVFLTGGSFTVRAQRFLESTANVSLGKPFDPSAIRRIAADYVR